MFLRRHSKKHLSWSIAKTNMVDDDFGDDDVVVVLLVMMVMVMVTSKVGGLLLACSTFHGDNDILRPCLSWPSCPR